MQNANNLINTSNFSREEFNYTSILINSNWVLVNNIDTSKTIYCFHEDNVLSINKNNSVSKATWHYVNANYIKITSKNKINIIKIAFRDKDILTLDINRASSELAVFINESKTRLNSHDDITAFLHKKYINKAKNIIYTHNYYYVEKSIEYGPFTAKQLITKAKNNTISSQCFIRETNDIDYSKRLRVEDLMKVI